MGSHHIIHHGYGHDALGGTPPPSWRKPVLQKTKDELWDGIQYMLRTPGYGGLPVSSKDNLTKCCEECGVQYKGTAQQKYCVGCRDDVQQRQNRAASKVRERRRKRR